MERKSKGGGFKMENSPFKIDPATLAAIAAVASAVSGGLEGVSKSKKEEIEAKTKRFDEGDLITKVGMSFGKKGPLDLF